MASFRPLFLLAACMVLLGAWSCKPTPTQSSESPILEESPVFKLKGRNYETSYLFDPFVSRGQFEIWHTAEGPLAISVTSARYIHGDSIFPIPQFSVYVEGDTASVSPDSVIIPAQSKVLFWVTFVAIPFSESVREVPKVAISVQALGGEHIAVSEIRMVKRIPKF